MGQQPFIHSSQRHRRPTHNAPIIYHLFFLVKMCKSSQRKERSYCATVLSLLPLSPIHHSSSAGWLAACCCCWWCHSPACEAEQQKVYTRAPVFIRIFGRPLLFVRLYKNCCRGSCVCSAPKKKKERKVIACWSKCFCHWLLEEPPSPSTK